MVKSFAIGIIVILVALLTVDFKNSVEVTPRIGLAPSPIRITVRAEPKETNRGLTVTIESPDYSRSSFDPDFIGLDSPTIRTFTYELQYPGRYTIVATLHRTAPDSDVRSETSVCLSGEQVEC